MDLETLRIAQQLASDIERCNESIKKAQWIVSDNTCARLMYLKTHGLESDLQVPESLFKIIGAIVLATHKANLSKLEEKLQSL